MTGNEYDEKLTPADIKESLAATAVQIACKEVTLKVLKKHKNRGDSWHKTTSVFSMGELVHNKMHRVKELFKTNPLSSEVLKEINDELDDIIAYSAFQKYVLNVDKCVDVHQCPEEEK